MAEKRYIVKTTNIPNFTGIDAGGAAFANGTAVITDERMAEWFREHDGYTVTKQEDEKEEEDALKKSKKG